MKLKIISNENGHEIGEEIEVDAGVADILIQRGIAEPIPEKKSASFPPPNKAMKRERLKTK